MNSGKDHIQPEYRIMVYVFPIQQKCLYCIIPTYQKEMMVENA